MVKLLYVTSMEVYTNQVSRSNIRYTSYIVSQATYILLYFEITYYHTELRMGCHVHLEAEDRDGSPWTNCSLGLRGVIASQEFDPLVSWDLTDFRSDNDAANALAVLPWTSW